MLEDIPQCSNIVWDEQFYEATFPESKSSVTGTVNVHPARAGGRSEEC